MPQSRKNNQLQQLSGQSHRCHQQSQGEKLLLYEEYDTASSSKIRSSNLQFGVLVISKIIHYSELCT